MGNLKQQKFDDDFNLIANYQIIPFNNYHGKGGYAIRTIEIYRLHKMEALLKQFEQLTGYVAPRSNCTAEEIHLLIDQGEKVCLEAEEKVAEIKNEIMLCDRDLGNAKRGYLASITLAGRRQLKWPVAYGIRMPPQFLSLPSSCDNFPP